jgi:hypothetical protein
LRFPASPCCICCWPILLIVGLDLADPCAASHPAPRRAARRSSEAYSAAVPGLRGRRIGGPRSGCFVCDSFAPLPPQSHPGSTVMRFVR